MINPVALHIGLNKQGAFPFWPSRHVCACACNLSLHTHHAHPTARYPLAFLLPLVTTYTQRVIVQKILAVLQPMIWTTHMTVGAQQPHLHPQLIPWSCTLRSPVSQGFPSKFSSNLPTTFCLCRPRHLLSDLLIMQVSFCLFLTLFLPFLFLFSLLPAFFHSILLFCFYF